MRKSQFFHHGIPLKFHGIQNDGNPKTTIRVFDFLKINHFEVQEIGIEFFWPKIPLRSARKECQEPELVPRKRQLSSLSRFQPFVPPFPSWELFPPSHFEGSFSPPDLVIFFYSSNDFPPFQPMICSQKPRIFRLVGQPVGSLFFRLHRWGRSSHPSATPCPTSRDHGVALRWREIVAGS